MARKNKKISISPQSKDLISLLGLETALKMFIKLGGVNVEMGKKLKVCDYFLLEKLIGAEKAEIFHREYKGVKVYIPKNKTIFYELRKKRLQKTVKGYQRQGFSFYHSVKLACCDMKICENTALKLARESRKKENP